MQGISWSKCEKKEEKKVHERQNASDVCLNENVRKQQMVASFLSFLSTRMLHRPKVSFFIFVFFSFIYLFFFSLLGSFVLLYIYIFQPPPSRHHHHPLFKIILFNRMARALAWLLYTRACSRFLEKRFLYMASWECLT